MTRHSLAIGIGLIASAAAVAAPIRPEKLPDFSKLKEESIQKWSGAEVLLAGKVVKATAGAVGPSEPPYRTYKLDIAPEKVLRGSGKFDKQLSVFYSVRQQLAPTFPDRDKDCVIALKLVRDAWILQSVEESSAETIEQATIATSFPIGWTIKDGKLVSPWASVGKPGKTEGAACSVTGRPVLLTGPSVRFSIEPVPPGKKLQFGNPDGDGEYKLIVKNESEQEVEVPALLTDGKSIRWNECVVIRCQDKTYPIPGSTGSVTGLQSVVLKPGESVSGTTQVFALNGPPWPRGGSRLEFQFCLGEKSATHSFYYLSRHHDPIREAIQKELMK